MKSITALLILSCSTGTAFAKKPKANGKCDGNIAVSLHNTAHCVFFFVPQSYSHPEDKHHFTKCCPLNRLFNKKYALEGSVDEDLGVMNSESSMGQVEAQEGVQAGERAADNEMLNQVTGDMKL